MEIISILNDEYGINNVSRVSKTESGSGNTYIVSVLDKMYLFKCNERRDFVGIFDKVSHYLIDKQVKQQRIIKTLKNDLMSKSGAVLYEYIEGITYRSFNEKQIESVLKYLKRYNHLLKDLPTFKIDELNNWDRAFDIDFIINDAPDIIQNSCLVDKVGILKAIKILYENKDIITANNQLIHADIGPDNFIFNKDELVTIIDFTPHYHHELFSIGQLIYWNYLWEDIPVDDNLLSWILKKYYDNDIKDELLTLKLLLLHGSIYRIMGLINDINNPNRLNKRIEILKRISNIL